MVRLSDVCDVRDGTHDSPKYVEYGYPLVTSKNIKDGQLDLSIVNFITEEDYNKINERSKVDVGDIIMPMIGTIGNPYLVEEFCDFAIKNVALIKCDNIKVINKFVWYFLQSNAFERYVDTKNKGGTQKFLSLGDIRAIELLEVSIDKQKHIVEILTRVDGIVAKRKQQLQKLDGLVKARFVEMFGDPVLNQYKWDIVTIGDVATDVRYGTSLPATECGRYPYLRMNNLTYDGYLDLTDMKYINIPENEIEKCVVRKGDVLFNRTNSLELVGKTCVFDLDEDMVIAGYIIRVRLNDKILPVVLSNYMNTKVLKEQLRSMAKGAVNQANINAQELRSISIYLPPIELQNQFSDFVQQIDKSKLSVQKSLDKLEILKKVLMQKYFG